MQNLNDIFYYIEFPEKWKYDFDMRRWYSEDYTYTEEGASFVLDTKGNYIKTLVPKTKKYIYLTDKKLNEINS